MDLFMHNHQSALDSFMEDKAIQDLEDAGIYPVPDNDDILEKLHEEVVAEWTEGLSWVTEIIGKPVTLHQPSVEAEVRRRFEELPEPGDYDA